VPFHSAKCYHFRKKTPGCRIHFGEGELLLGRAALGFRVKAKHLVLAKERFAHGYFLRLQKAVVLDGPDRDAFDSGNGRAGLGPSGASLGKQFGRKESLPGFLFHCSSGDFFGAGCGVQSIPPAGST